MLPNNKVVMQRGVDSLYRTRSEKWAAWGGLPVLTKNNIMGSMGWAPRIAQNKVVDNVKVGWAPRTAQDQNSGQCGTRLPTLPNNNIVDWAAVGSPCCPKSKKWAVRGWAPCAGQE